MTILRFGEGDWIPRERTPPFGEGSVIVFHFPSRFLIFVVVSGGRFVHVTLGAPRINGGFLPGFNPVGVGRTMTL